MKHIASRSRSTRRLCMRDSREGVRPWVRYCTDKGRVVTLFDALVSHKLSSGLSLILHPWLYTHDIGLTPRCKSLQSP